MRAPFTSRCDKSIQRSLKVDFVFIYTYRERMEIFHNVVKNTNPLPIQYKKIAIRSKLDSTIKHRAMFNLCHIKNLEADSL